MKLAIAATVAGIAVGVTAAFAESKKPQVMTEAQMDQVYAGSAAPFIAMRVGGENNQELIVLPNDAINATQQNGGVLKAPKRIHPGNAESIRTIKK